MEENNKLMLIDGHSILNRAYFAGRYANRRCLRVFEYYVQVP